MQTSPLAHKIAVAYRPLADLQLDPKNPRAHCKVQLRQLKRSITTFGFIVPVLVDAKLKVIAGHGRVIACRELGWSEVPTICLEHLTEAQARAFMIADNRLAETSTWDDKLLAEQLKELSILELDFSLDTIGFDMGEIDFRIQGLEAEPEDDPADVLPPASAIAVTAPGDLWQLGEHRILCADSLLAPSYERLMAGSLATVVFEDAPYNCPRRLNIEPPCRPNIEPGVEADF